MKVTKVFSLIAAAAVSLVSMTSCLDDSNDTFNGSACAVARTNSSGVTVLDAYTTYYGIIPLYSQSAASWAVPGQCYIIEYNVDTGDADNENYSSNGFYVATIAKTSDIEKGDVRMVATNTSELLANEEIITQAAGLAYINSYLFLGAIMNQTDKQQNAFYMFGDMNQEAQKGDNGNYYNLYLRVTQSVAGSGTESALEDDRSFNVSPWITQFTAIEKAAGKSSYQVRINYPSAVDSSDSTKITWSYFNLTVPISTSSSSN